MIRITNEDNVGFFTGYVEMLHSLWFELLKAAYTLATGRFRGYS
jgi:hypothetical protein